MTNYNELIESLRNMEPMVCGTAADAIEYLWSRVSRLLSELEREYIRLVACGVVAMSDTPESAQEARDMREEFRSASCDDVARQVDKLMELRNRVAELEAERAEREKQGPVAHEYQGRDGIWRGFINQQHYKNTVEDGSWPIRALYAAPPITAPVRLTDSEAEAVARIHGTGGWQTMADMMKFSRAIETAVLRANGFKVEE